MSIAIDPAIPPHRAAAMSTVRRLLNPRRPPRRRAGTADPAGSLLDRPGPGPPAGGGAAPGRLAAAAAQRPQAPAPGLDRGRHAREDVVVDLHQLGGHDVPGVLAGGHAAGPAPPPPAQ